MPKDPAGSRSSWSKMERIHRQSLLLYTMKSGTTSAPARPFGHNYPVFAKEIRRGTVSAGQILRLQIVQPPLDSPLLVHSSRWRREAADLQARYVKESRGNFAFSCELLHTTDAIRRVPRCVLQGDGA